MYVKIVDGQVDTFPYSIVDLKKENPNTSFPARVSEELLNSFGVYSVSYANQPDINVATHKIVESTEPSLVDGAWTVTYTSTALSTEEKELADTEAAVKNRDLRNASLATTDWWGASDVTMTTEQTAYRQALRDITTHSNWPHLQEDDWPTKP